MTDDDTAPPLTEAAQTIARLAQIVKDLERQLGSARDWAVALENRIEKACDLASVYAGEIDDFARAVVAALTGGEDE